MQQKPSTSSDLLSKRSNLRKDLGKAERTIRMHETLLYKKTLPIVIAQELEYGLLDKVLTKKNRHQVKQNRLSDYKNEECCDRKNRRTLNKERIRNLRKLRKCFRGFLLEKIIIMIQ